MVFEIEILKSSFTVDVQNSGAAFMPFGTKLLRFYAFWHEAAPLLHFSRKGLYRFLAEPVHRFGFFIAVNSKGQVRPF